MHSDRNKQSRENVQSYLKHSHAKCELVVIVIENEVKAAILYTGIQLHIIQRKTQSNEIYFTCIEIVTQLKILFIIHKIESSYNSFISH